MARRCGALDEARAHQDGRVVVGPSLGGVQRAIHGPLQLTADLGVLASGILGGQLDIDVSLRIGVPMRPADVQQQDPLWTPRSWPAGIAGSGQCHKQPQCLEGRSGSKPLFAPRLADLSRHQPGSVLRVVVIAL
eukprot:3429685-Lingulodinium_polyedra.AAC.2